MMLRKSPPDGTSIPMGALVTSISGKGGDKIVFSTIKPNPKRRVNEMSTVGYVRRVCLAIVVSVGILLITGSLSGLRAEVKEGGTLVIGWTQEPKHLFPLMEATIQGGLIHRAGLYETLVGLNERLEPVPMLAKSWDQEENGTKLTFHLVDKAKWHDGKPLTSKDVKFTVEYVQENKLSSAMPYVRDIARVEAPDPTSVVVYYEKPIAGVINNFQYLFIVPEDHLKDITGKDALSYTNPNPVGSGPFKFVSWKKTNEIVLTANPDYWQGRPHLDRVIFKYFANVNTLLLALKSGQIDVIPWELTEMAAEEFKSLPEIEVTVDPNIYYRWINFNVSEFGKQNPTLRDRSVRIALNHAIDRKYLADLIHLGYVTPGTQVVQPSTPFWCNKNLHPYEFNLDLSNNILDKAGYTDRDKDGVRKSKAGTRLEYDLLVLQRFTEEVRAAEHIRDTWKEIGIKLNIQVVDGATILSKLFPNYEQDMYFWGFDGRPDPSFILGILTKDQIQNYNGAGYNNPVYDALFELQKTLTNVDERKKVVFKMQEILHIDAPHAVLYDMSAIAAYRSDKVAGFVRMPAGIFSNLNTYCLKKAHLIK